MATALTSPKIPGKAPNAEGLQVSIRQRRRSESGFFEGDAEFSLSNGISILFGPSGAGKTTLLDCIAGLCTPESGRIGLANRVLFDSAQGTNLPARERNIGYVFQDLALFPHINVEENVGYGLARVPPAQRKQRVLAVLDSLGISSLRERRPDQLSGGEKQRVALARALVTNPSALLLDEPLAGLDLPVRMKIADDLRRSIQGRPIPVLYVTHNREEVFMLGENMLVLEAGKVIGQGTPHQVLSAPQSETIAQLAGFENILDVTVSSVHEDRGTLTCRLDETDIQLETPLVRAQAGTRLRVGISAGDILLATSPPVGLSARNLLQGKLLSLEQRDVIVEARVCCGVEFSVHLTLSARDSLRLAPGADVWLIVKTHSCHLLAT